MNDWGDHMLKIGCWCCYSRNCHNKEFKGLMKNCTSCAKVLYDAKCINLEFGDLYYFFDDIKGHDETLDIDNEPRYGSESIANQYCMTCYSVVVNGQCSCCKKPSALKFDNVAHRICMTCNYMILNGKCNCSKGPLGLKFDESKPMFSCLPPHGLTELGKIAALGASKYGKDNYRSGIKVSRLLDAAYRHLIAASDGKDHDEVDGNNHLASVAWNVLAALQVIKDYPELDDRYYHKGKKDL